MTPRKPKTHETALFALPPFQEAPKIESIGGFLDALIGVPLETHTDPALGCRECRITHEGVLAALNALIQQPEHGILTASFKPRGSLGGGVRVSSNANYPLLMFLLSSVSAMHMRQQFVLYLKQRGESPERAQHVLQALEKLAAWVNMKYQEAEKTHG